MANGDGTEPIVSFRQCKLLGIQGVLFWGVNEWRDNMYDLYEPATNSWGDGILIYSGAPFGIDTPVSSCDWKPSAMALRTTSTSVCWSRRQASRRWTNWCVL